MGLKMGVIAFRRESKAPFEKVMKLLDGGARHVGPLPPDREVYFLDEMEAVVGVFRGITFVFNKHIASVLSSDATIFGRPKNRPWIEKEAKKCDILVAFGHSIAQVYSHALFLDGRIVGAESNAGGPYDCVSYKSRFPEWYEGPSERFAESYALQLADGFAGCSLSSEWLDERPPLELYLLR